MSIGECIASGGESRKAARGAARPSMPEMTRQAAVVPTTVPRQDTGKPGQLG